MPILSPGRLIALAAGLMLSIPSFAQEPKIFRAGAAVVDISPQVYPVIVNAMFTERSATQTVDRLSARSVVLDDGTTRLALVIVDTCMMPRDLIDAAKASASRGTGIPAQNMMISATHTHSAPAAMGCLGSRADTNYAALLPGKIAAAIAQAAERLVPARIGWASVDDWKHTYNRRWIRRPDRMLQDPFGQRNVRAHMHPGHESLDVVGPSGPVDPELYVLAVQSRAGEPLALVANYSQHYYGSPLLSSDYYGRFAEHITKRIGAGSGFVAAMSQGTSGDLMWMDYGAPRHEIGYDAYAREMAEQAINAYETIQYQDWVELKAAERKLKLEYRVPEVARLNWARETAARIGERLPQSLPEIYAWEAIYLSERPSTELVLQALKIGELGIAALPNEVYAITGLKLKAQSPLRSMFNIELANGAEGYIPPPEQHDLGGYTTWPARTAGLEAQAEPRIVQTLLELLEELSGRSRVRTSAAPGVYTEAVLRDRPHAYWRFEEFDGPEFRDFSGHNRSGKAEAGLALYLPGVGSGDGSAPELKASSFRGEGEINRAIHFAGGRVKADLPDLGGDYSVEFWFWNGLPHDVRPVTGYMFSRGPDRDAAAAGEHLGIGGTYGGTQSGKLILFNGNELNQVLVGRTQLHPREWHHVALVRRGTKAAVYLDGSEAPEIEGELPNILKQPSPHCFIGGRSDGFANFEGKIDEVAFYDRTLTAAEIAAHFRASNRTSSADAAGASQNREDAPGSDAGPLSPEESLKKIRVPPGFRVEWVAAEPLVLDPVAIDWDAAGRLWVVEMADYPLGMDGREKPGGRIRVLEDSNGDGRYDRATLFAEGLKFPNGILTWRDGVLVTAAPDILFLRDTNGDGKADVKEVLLTGFLEGNQQLRVNGLRWGLDGWVYCAAGGHHRGHGAGTVVRSTRAGVEVASGSRDLRFQPDTGLLEPESGPAQFGRNRDDWGHWFGTQNSLPLWHYVLDDRYLRRNPHYAAPDPAHQLITPRNPKVFPISPREQRFHSFAEAGHFTSACSGMIYRDNLLFADDERHAFVCEPFHNLVHHAVLSEEGISFSARRAPGEQASEFFASSEQWSRPVMIRTGPDGALWVVDMYRHMIEHPDWLPEQGKAALLPHYRRGDQHGRIYRIVSEAKPARKVRRLDQRSAAEWVAVLDSPNGWERDKAQQLLLWSGDPAAVPHLEALAKSGTVLGRLHALWTLQGLRALKLDFVARALQAEHPGLRLNGLRLAETFSGREIVESAAALAADADPKVRLQLALTLGEWTNAVAGAVLGRLAREHATDPWFRAALLSSAVPHGAALVEAALAGDERVRAALFEPLVTLSVGLNRREWLADLLRPVLVPNNGQFSAGQLSEFSMFIEILARRNRTVDSLRRGADDSLSACLSRVADLFKFAAAFARDESQPSGQRLTAAALLARDPSQRSQGLDLMGSWLAPQVSKDLQLAAIGRISGVGGDGGEQALLARWESSGPELRGAMVEALAGRESWAVALLQCVIAGEIARNNFDAGRRERLLRHRSVRVRELAEEAFSAGGTGSDESRAEVIERYRPVLGLGGSAERGAAIYNSLCISCHRREGQGNEIGPDLVSVAGHPPEKLLANILDPNADVQPGYHAYGCVLIDGEELYGIIAAETASSLILKLADGTTRTVLRRDIAALRGTGISLMPEGLEAGLTHQQVADLIRFLRGRDE